MFLGARPSQSSPGVAPRRLSLGVAHKKVGWSVFAEESEGVAEVVLPNQTMRGEVLT